MSLGEVNGNGKNNERWLSLYRSALIGLATVSFCLLAYFSSATLGELKTIRDQQTAFGQSLVSVAGKTDENRTQIINLWQRDVVKDAEINDLKSRTKLLEYRVQGRR